MLAILSFDGTVCCCCPIFMLAIIASNLLSTSAIYDLKSCTSCRYWFIMFNLTAPICDVIICSTELVFSLRCKSILDSSSLYILCLSCSKAAKNYGSCKILSTFFPIFYYDFMELFSILRYVCESGSSDSRWICSLYSRLPYFLMVCRSLFVAVAV